MPTRLTRGPDALGSWFRVEAESIRPIWVLSELGPLGRRVLSPGTVVRRAVSKGGHASEASRLGPEAPLEG